MSTQVLTIDTESYRDAWVAQCNAQAAGAVPVEFALAQIRQGYDLGAPNVVAAPTVTPTPVATVTVQPTV